MFNDTQQVIEYPKLCIHAGGRVVDLQEVVGTRTPDGTATWAPMPHSHFVEEVRRTAERTGYRVCSETHALAGVDDARYFGIMALQANQPARTKDAAWDMVLGLRNSHDKTFPISLAAGMRVFVCDNLSFSGEVKVGRKHTRHASRDLGPLLNTAFSRVVETWGRQSLRVNRYSEHELGDSAAYSIIVRAAQMQALPDTQVMRAVQQWHEPAFEDFRPRNAWSLFNAVTHVLKQGSVETIVKRTQVLHSVLDQHCGLVS